MDDDRPPAPYYQPARPWPNNRPAGPWAATVARIGMIAVPIVMIISAVVGSSAGPAVFGGIWLPCSLWFVVIKPRREARANRPTR